MDTGRLTADPTWPLYHDEGAAYFSATAGYSKRRDVSMHTRLQPDGDKSYFILTTGTGSCKTAAAAEAQASGAIASTTIITLTVAGKGGSLIASGPSPSLGPPRAAKLPLLGASGRAWQPGLAPTWNWQAPSLGPRG
jgi:hypothetical protein